MSDNIYQKFFDLGALINECEHRPSLRKKIMRDDPKYLVPRDPMQMRDDYELRFLDKYHPFKDAIGCIEHDCLYGAKSALDMGNPHTAIELMQVYRMLMEALKERTALVRIPD